MRVNDYDEAMICYDDSDKGEGVSLERSGELRFLTLFFFVIKLI